MPILTVVAHVAGDPKQNPQKCSKCGMKLGTHPNSGLPFEEDEYLFEIYEDLRKLRFEVMVSPEDWDKRIQCTSFYENEI